ncbi:MAG: redoxin domain-containing protein [Bacillaceae bacterium]|nr:redoxin domain-containing protein [Bacillaceae bacterium]
MYVSFAIFSLAIISLLLPIVSIRETLLFTSMIKVLPKKPAKIDINGPKLGTFIGDLEVVDSEMNLLTLSEFLSKETVLMFADTGCIHCSSHLERFIVAKNEFQKYDFVVLVNQSNIDFNQYRDISLPTMFLNEGDEAMSKLNINLLPTFIFVSKKGQVLSVLKSVRMFQKLFDKYEKVKLDNNMKND